VLGQDGDQRVQGSVCSAALARAPDRRGPLHSVMSATAPQVSSARDCTAGVKHAWLTTDVPLVANTASVAAWSPERTSKNPVLVRPSRSSRISQAPGRGRCARDTTAGSGSY